MKSTEFRWNEDKLKTAVVIFWLITVFASLFGVTFSLGYIDRLGAVFPFRVLLPITALLYLIWMIREKYNPWKHASYLLQLCYIFCISLALYGGISLFWAIDFEYSFRSWFNLCLALCFFFLALELCQERSVFIYTIWCSVPAFLLQMSWGVIEAFSGGIFYPERGVDHNITFFGRACYWPVGSIGNPNDYSMMLLFMLALYFLYWTWRRKEEKSDLIPVLLIAPVYFLIHAGSARLCEVAFIILMAGFVVYALSLQRKKCWILILSILLLSFVTFGFHYQNIVSEKDHLQNQESIFVSASAAPIEVEEEIPLAAKPSLKDEFFVVDDETGETQMNMKGSAGIRLYLLMYAADCFIDSKGMGVGVGNTEQLVRVSETNTSGIWNIHCFLARMAADYGIFFLIPLVLIVFELLRKTFQNMIQGIKEKRASEAAKWILYLCVLITYPIASTAPSDAQDAHVMWLFLAGVVLFPMYLQKTESK